MVDVISYFTSMLRDGADYETRTPTGICGQIESRKAMYGTSMDRRLMLLTAASVFGLPLVSASAAFGSHSISSKKDLVMTQITFTKLEPPAWLMAFWREIDNKTWGAGFDCFTEDAVCNLGVADWHGREAIRENLRNFIDSGFTAHHDVLEYWDSPHLKVFRGKVTMTPDNGGSAVHPTMTHFFYMDEKDNSKVKHWYGAVGPMSFA